MNNKLMISLFFLLGICSVIFLPMDSKAEQKTYKTKKFEYALYDNQKDAVEIVRYIGKKTTVQVPKKIKGKKVVSLSASAFSYSDVKTVSLPNTIKELGSF